MGEPCLASSITQRLSLRIQGSVLVYAPLQDSHDEEIIWKFLLAKKMGLDPSRVPPSTPSDRQLISPSSFLVDELVECIEKSIYPSDGLLDLLFYHFSFLEDFLDDYIFGIISKASRTSSGRHLWPFITKYFYLLTLENLQDLLNTVVHYFRIRLSMNKALEGPEHSSIGFLEYLCAVPIAQDFLIKILCMNECEEIRHKLIHNIRESKDEDLKDFCKSLETF